MHFNSIGHNALHLKVTPIELMVEGDRLNRRAREAYWQTKLGSIFPNGLNNFPTHHNHLFKNLLNKQPHQCHTNVITVTVITEIVGNYG